MRDKIIESEILRSKGITRAFMYARDIIEERWPGSEPFIMIDPEYAYYYARDIIKGRWPEAEPFIMKNPGYAYCYARDIIKGRWKEAEPFIMKSSQCSYYYAKHIIKERWQLIEYKFIDSKSDQLVMDFILIYCLRFLSNYNSLLPLWIKYYTHSEIITTYFN